MQTVVFHCFAYTYCTISFQPFCGMSAIRYKVLTDRARRYVTERLLNTKVVKGEYRAKFIRTLLSRIHNLTQEELSLKSGLGLRFVRDLEQDKETLRLDKGESTP